MVSELEKYRVIVAGLQETKWFGNEVYKVGESMVLSAGRDVPRERRNGQRGEGVAIIPSGPAVNAWRASGSQRKAWGLKLITATLEIGSGRSGRLHVLSCFSSNLCTSREEKNSVFDLLQDDLSSIPAEECYVMLVDFNAHVGSRAVRDDDRLVRAKLVVGRSVRSFKRA